MKELLPVILSTIALIAILIVMNVIENPRKGVVERSAENYIRTVATNTPVIVYRWS